MVNKILGGAGNNRNRVCFDSVGYRVMNIFRLIIPALLGCLFVSPTKALTIDIINTSASGAGMSANAFNAFERAADTWSALFTDPIVVTVDVGTASLGSTILGSAFSVKLKADFNAVRNVVIADAENEASNGVVAFLPDAGDFGAFLPGGFSLENFLTATRANFKALGFSEAQTLTTKYGITDAFITFSDGFAFDYNNSNGITGGTIDFETVALHELGHALGFVSVVDEVDARLNENDPNDSGVVSTHIFDLFRFEAADAPSSDAEFATATRSLLPGGMTVFADGDDAFALSTGRFTGDGNQASHWLDGSFPGVELLGIMDPTLAAGQVIDAPSLADIRALDLMGYDVAVPVPAALPLFGTGLGLLGIVGWRRRRRVVPATAATPT